MTWNLFKKTNINDIFLEDSLEDFNAVKNITNVTVDSAPSCINHKFGKYLANLLKLNMITGPWLAGGMLQKLYHGQSPSRSDWDIWFNNHIQFENAKQILGKYCKYPHITKNSITYSIKFEDVEYKVQLINTQFFKTAKDVIDQFDFSVCQMITDNRTMLLGEHTAKDLKSKTLRLVSPLKDGVISRLTKYIVYGYTPDLELIEFLKEYENDNKWKPASDY
jgi:hypothetical protein